MRRSMKKPLPKLLAAAAALLALAVLCLEPFPWSGSAAADLTAAMEALHGPAYAGREIAAHMNISPSTVKRHLSAIKEKLEISNRSELKQYMLR